MRMKYLISLLMALILGGSLAAASAQVSLRVAVWEAAEPYYFRQGEDWAGVCVDILRALQTINARRQFVLPTLAMPIRRVESEFVAGRFDLICGARKTESRLAAGMQYLRLPVHMAGNRLAVRADDTVQVRNWDDVRKLEKQGTVLMVQGNAESQRLAREGVLVDASSPSGEQNIRKLLAGRGRFFFARDSYFRSVAPKLKEYTQIRLLPVMLDVSGIYIMLSPQTPAATLEQLDQDFQKLVKSGELARILRSYEIE